MKIARWGGMQNSQSSWIFNHSSASSVIDFTLGVVALARPVVEAIQRKDRDLASWFFNHSSASQLRRAMSSMEPLLEAMNQLGGRVFGLVRR